MAFDRGGGPLKQADINVLTVNPSTGPHYLLTTCSAMRSS